MLLWRIGLARAHFVGDIRQGRPKLLLSVMSEDDI